MEILSSSRILLIIRRQLGAVALGLDYGGISSRLAKLISNKWVSA